MEKTKAEENTKAGENAPGAGAFPSPEPGKQQTFVCVRDCYRDRKRYRKGDRITGAACPPCFKEQPAPDAEEDRRE
jgi:hypothetical protein